MALILKKELESGLILEEAYCKVEEINANKEKMNFYLSTYLNKEARDNNKAPLETRFYSCNHNVLVNKNSIRQAYMYLKSLEDFSEAIDDLE